MDLEEFKAFLAENKDSDEVKELIGAKPDINAEIVTNYLKSDAGRPIVDKYINDAIRSHDEKKAPEIEKLVREAAEAARKEGTMTAEERLQDEVRKINEKLAESEAKAALQMRNTELVQYATDKQVPSKLIAAILANPGLTVDSGKEGIDAIADGLEEVRKTSANATLINESHKPGSGDSGDSEINIEGLDWNDPADREKLLAAVADGA